MYIYTNWRTLSDSVQEFEQYFELEFDFTSFCKAEEELALMLE